MYIWLSKSLVNQHAQLGTFVGKMPLQDIIFSESSH